MTNDVSTISRDFDFLHGRWHVHNRRLLRPLTGSSEWSDFDGTSVVRPVWDGRACLEEWEASAPGVQLSAVSLHLYDPRARQWNLHWATRASGRVGVPTAGEFANGRGVFYAQEDHEGVSVFLRIILEQLGASACRFEQAFSADGGASWETNWIMDFTRAAIDEPLASQSADRSRGGARDFDFLHGHWSVRNRRLRAPLAASNEWYDFEGAVSEYPFWNGDGNLEEYNATLPDGTALRGLALRLYQPDTKRWTINWANGASGTLDAAMTGAFVEGRGAFFSQERYDYRAIFVRFLWSSAGANSARWEQSFSADGGQSWEVNWIMDISRTGP
jgi:hypothetical protein